ncbi:UNC-like C-terminal-domain-containing protein [Mycena vitilis]|nr:UNC-like C-terminal-domain-containing protein [Mycena vitilis]
MNPFCAVARAQCSQPAKPAAEPDTENITSVDHLQYNFALDVAGARVIYQMTSATFGLTSWCNLKRWWTTGEASCGHEFILPTEILRSGDAVEGECWPFEGGRGHITIRLAERANISNLTIQRVVPFSSAGISQAPRAISLWGLFPLPRDVHSTDSFILLAQIEYDISADSRSLSSTQTFPVQPAESWDGFRLMVLDVTSNWGSPSTCISRVRIHGIPAD